MSKRKSGDEDGNDDEDVNEIVRIINSSANTNFDFTDNEINEIVQAMRKNSGIVINTPDTLFNVTLLRTNIRFNRDENIFRITVEKDKLQTLPDFLNNIRNVFQYFINVAKVMSSSPKDKVRFYISNAPRTPFSTAVMGIDEITAEHFFHIFEKHMQSNASEVLNHDWSTDISVFVLSHLLVDTNMRKRQKKKQIKIYKYLNSHSTQIGKGKPLTKLGREVRKGVFQIRSDGLDKDVRGCCFVLSVLCGMSFLKNDEKAKKIRLNMNVCLNEIFTVQDVLTVYEQAKLVVGGVKTTQLASFYENYLRTKQIDLVVFSKEHYDSIIYDSRLDKNDELSRLTDNVIYLWLNDNHYDLILAPKQFSRITRCSFCYKCMRYFKNGETSASHTCRTKRTCLKCYSFSKCDNERGAMIECSSCNILFTNIQCFQKHLQNKVFMNGTVTPCNAYFFCKKCYKIISHFHRGKRQKHSCDSIYCFHCSKSFKKKHECFIKPTKPSNKGNHPTLFFYDFETKNDKDGYMIPFYCVVQKVCSLCDKIPFEKTYEYFLPHPENLCVDISVESVSCCGYRQYVFMNNSDCVVKDLLDFMFKQTPNSVWVAHNGGRFDNVFLLRELLTKRNIVPKTVMNGNKIITMEIEEFNIKFVDSFLFLSMRLSAFPKALGIKDAAKGYHPYRFTDLTYVGEMISTDYFDLAAEGSDERKKFDEWYNLKCEKTYTFADEIYYYCRTDVDILRQGCVTFSSLINEITNVFPFYDKTCNTIAGLALKFIGLIFLRKKQ